VGAQLDDEVELAGFELDPDDDPPLPELELLEPELLEPELLEPESNELAPELPDPEPDPESEPELDELDESELDDSLLAEAASPPELEELFDPRLSVL
jgi:hypothetical protein